MEKVTDEKLDEVIDIYRNGGLVPSGNVLHAIAVELREWRGRLAAELKKQTESTGSVSDDGKVEEPK